MFDLSLHLLTLISSLLPFLSLFNPRYIIERFATVWPVDICNKQLNRKTNPIRTFWNIPYFRITVVQHLNYYQNTLSLIPFRWEDSYSDRWECDFFFLRNRFFSLRSSSWNWGNSLRHYGAQDGRYKVSRFFKIYTNQYFSGRPC